jgi:lysophospholipase L1-like esterase
MGILNPPAVTRGQLNGITGLINYREGMILRTSAALAATRENSADTLIAFCGDSTERGTIDGGGAAQFGNGPPVKVARLLATAGYNIAHDNVFGNLASGSLPSSDTRVVFAGTIGNSNNVPGGRFFTLSGSGAKVTFTPTVNCDRFDVYTVQNTGLGTLALDINGGAATNVVGNGAKTVVKTTLSPALGANTINVSWVSGTAHLIGIDAYNSNVKRVRCLNMGWPSSTSTQWAVTGNIWEPRPLLSSTILRPNCIVLNLGLNDMNTAPVNSATFKSNMLAMIADWKANSDVIMKAWAPAGSGWADQATQDDHLARLYEVALEADVPLINTLARIPSWTAGNSLSMYSGSVHMSADGYSVPTRLVANFLSSL